MIFLFFFQNGNKTDQCGNNGHLLPVQQKLEINIFFFCLTILELLLLYLSFRFLCIYLKFSPQTAKSNRIYGWPDTCIALVTIDYIHKGFKKVVFHFIRSITTHVSLYIFVFVMFLQYIYADHFVNFSCFVFYL